MQLNAYFGLPEETPFDEAVIPTAAAVTGRKCTPGEAKAVLEEVQATRARAREEVVRRSTRGIASRT